MTAWGMAIPCIIRRMCGKSTFPVSSSEAESRGLFRWRQEGECLRKRNGKHRIAERWTVFPINGLAKKSWKKGTKKISRYARNDSVGDGYPVHHTKNVWETHVSRIVIPSEVEGSFSLMVRRRVSDSEEREIPYRGKADGVSRKRLSEGGGKRGTEKISRYALNDGMENVYPVHHTKNVWETRSSRIVIPRGAEGSFSLAVRRRVSDGEKRETPYRGKAVCHGNKKRGGIPLFLYFDGSPSSSLSSPTVSAIASAPW